MAWGKEESTTAAGRQTNVPQQGLVVTRAGREERTLMVTHFNPTREPASLEQPASLEPGSGRAYRIADVCKVTGLGRTSIYAAIKSGALVARKWNRRTIVLAEDLAAFLCNLPTVR
jgi:hypothetical protein